MKRRPHGEGSGAVRFCGGIMRRGEKEAFTLVEIMVVVAIVGLLAVIAIPSYVRATEVSRKQACMNNLRLLDGAKDTWAFEMNKGSGDPVVGADLDPYLKRGYAGVIEPLGGSYTLGVIGTDPTCSLFDATRHPATL